VTARAPIARGRRRPSRVSAMAARYVGIASAASQVGKAPRHRGQAPSVREELVVQADQVVAVISVAGAEVVAVRAEAEAAAVRGGTGVAGDGEPGEGRIMPRAPRSHVVTTAG
jgi:hypothetical protein